MLRAALLETALVNVREGVTAVDATGKVLYANEAAARMIGYPSVERLLEAPVEEWTRGLEMLREDGSPLPPAETPSGRAFFVDAPCDGVIRCRGRVDGVDRWAQVTAQRVCHGADAPVVVSVFQDVSEQVRRDRAQEALGRVSAVLARSNEPSVALTELAHTIVPALAEGCVIHGGDPPLRATAHVEPESAPHLAALNGLEALDAGPPDEAPRATHPGRGRLVRQLTDAWLAERARSPGHLESLRALGLRSLITVPLSSRARTEGVLTLVTLAGGRAFDESDLAVAEDLATRAAAFLENARLVRDARAARDAAEAQSRRFQVLADTSRLLAEAGVLYPDRVLAAIVRQVGSVIGEACVICTLSADGETTAQRAAWYADPHIEELARDVMFCAPRSDHTGYLGQVLRTGQRVLEPRVDREALLAQCRMHGLDGAHDPPVPKTFAVLPLRAHGRVFGALALGRFHDERPYDASELALAEELTDRASLALESARLYQEAKEADAARAMLLEAERDANRAKDEFLAMLGHELRNPLAPLLGLVELRRLRLAGQPDRETDILERQVRQLTRLVDDLLDVARVTRGTIELRRQRVRLRAAVDEAIETTAPLVESRAHRLEVDVPPDLELDADPPRLTQILVNLLNNAAKYTPNGGWIGVSARRVGPRVRISVRDDGRGVSPELLSRMFDVFVQGPRGLERAEAGLGVGLTVVRKLVELHGGRVEARSEGIGRGTEIILELPLPTPAATEREGRSSSPPGRPHRVLVVDDNIDGGEMLCEALATSGHQTWFAPDAAAALELARRHHPDVALLDIGLPGMNGLELARAVRAMPELGPIGLVAVTGYGQPSDRERSRQAGFDAHLVKPVDMAEVARTIEEAAPVAADGHRV